MKIGELKPNIYFSNEKYVSLDALIDGIRVLVACINQFQLAKQSLKEPVKQILRRCIEKKKENVAPKNVWFGDWEYVRQNLVSASLISAFFIALETAILNADIVKAKKSVEKKKHLQVVNNLKKFVEATTIIKQILDLRVSFIVDKNA